MTHVVLAGDSVFNNANYVQEGFSVSELLEVALPGNCKNSMIAVNGCFISEVSEQLKQLPEDTSHLFLSCGGQDAITLANALEKHCNNAAEYMDKLISAGHEYTKTFHSLLLDATSQVKNVMVCTLHKSAPGMMHYEFIARSLLNEIILREAFEFDLPVMDLRLMLNEEIDYCQNFPHEISEYGGRKIVLAIAKIMKQHDFTVKHSSVYH